MKQWYYAYEGKQHGPVLESDLVRLIKSHEITADTLVWAEGLTEWTPVRDVAGLLDSDEPVDALTLETPILDAQHIEHDDNKGDSGYIPSGHQVRPWVRYWARFIDFSVFVLLIRILLPATFPEVDYEQVNSQQIVIDTTSNSQLFLEILNAMILGLFVAITYLFIESAMLSSWGTTPGKAFLKVRLRDSKGEKLTYGTALRRSIRVWIRGQGMSIPLIELFSQLSAYNRLKKQQITSWDEEENFMVNHQVIGSIRVGIALFSLFVFVVFPQWKSFIEQMNRYYTS